MHSAPAITTIPRASSNSATRRDSTVLDEVPFVGGDDPHRQPENTNAVWASFCAQGNPRRATRTAPASWPGASATKAATGANAQSAFDYMSATTRTRPAFISQQKSRAKNPRTDFEDYHYPAIPELRSLATNSSRLKIPAILHEQPSHSCVRAGDGL